MKRKKVIRPVDADLLREVMEVFKQEGNKEIFKRSLQQIFIKTALQKGQVLIEQANNTGEIKGLLVWKIRVQKPPKTANHSFGPGDCQNDFLVISNKYKRQGVGRRLMWRFEKLAKDKGCERTVLHCQQDNKTAVKFYKSLGYKSIGLIDQSGSSQYEFVKPVKGRARAELNRIPW